MRNGNIVVGFALFVIAVLIAEGKVSAAWDAIMNGANAGNTASALPPDNGVVAPDGSAPASWGTAGATAPPRSTKNFVPAIISGINTQIQQKSYILGSGKDPALELAYNNWPAGHQQEWNDFLDCYYTNGSVGACATLNISGKG